MYLSFSADYLRPSLVEVDGLAVELETLRPSEELERAIEEWNDRYQDIVSMDLKDRTTPRIGDLIDDLDCQGLGLAKEILRLLPPGSKIVYYSEGRLRRIDV